MGEGVSAWVLANADSHKLMRLNSVTEMAETHGGLLCKEKNLSKLKSPEGVKELEKRIMRYSDTDINGHVNNTRYADFACDALRMDKLSGDYYLAELQIGYLAECRAGEVLNILSGESEDGRTYICGNDEEGKNRFEAMMLLRKTEEEK